MKKIIFLIGFFILLSSLVLGFTATRTLPSTVTPSGTFTVTYTINPQGAPVWGGLITDDLTGGCTFGADQQTKIRAGYFSNDDPLIFSIKAPSSGSCTFHGNALVGVSSDNQQTINFNDATITIGSSSCTPNRPSNTCGTDNCGNSYNNCGSGKICQSETCVAGNTTIEKCEDNTDKQFWQQIKDNKCQVATWVWVAGGALLLFIFFIGMK